MNILITGGSGFIGTNLIKKLQKDSKYTLRSIDIAEPKVKQHRSIWHKVDIRDKEKLTSEIVSFSPDYVIHLAARTDLNGKTLQDYDANIQGVTNLLDALEKVPNLKQAVFASSMYVCEPGYMPMNFEDYAPHTLYGESKVETERRIKECNPRYTWSIIRPTSIWGPWFGEPYNKFFHIVLRHMYFHMGKRACRKTYGYVENAIYEIMSIFEVDAEKVNRKVFYIGDYEPYDITEWANEIAKESGIWIPKIPYWCFKCAGWFGDLLKKFGIAFPMTSFRLHNMTTDNVHNLEPIKAIAPNLPISRIEGTKKTLDWINTVEKKQK
ncbi:Nucleoside-diphosphate-sugar epimerase [Segatella bryantii]|nr:Nucleoside-diphosphate-sugar epimerase [Segatella bryantii]